MKSSMTMRVVFIVAAIVLAAYMLYPTIRLSMLSEAEKEQLQNENPEELINLKARAINLGLDLQGGMHVVLEVDVKELLDKLAKNKNQPFIDALTQTEEIVRETDENFIDLFAAQLEERGMQVTRYFGSAERREKADVIAYLNEQTEEAVDRSLEILRNRVDEFGVSEPTIQKQGDRRIIVELAGVTEPARVRQLIGKTALLEFKLVKSAEVTNRVAERINEFIQNRLSQPDTATTAKPGDAQADETEVAAEDTSTATALEELFGVEEGRQDTAMAAPGEGESMITEQLFFRSPVDPQQILVPAEHEEKFNKIIEMPEVRKIIAEEAGSAEFMFGSPNSSAEEYLSVYLLNKKQEMTGESIVDTRPQTGSMADPASVGKFEVSLTFNDDGARTFARVTGANIGKRLAIILDKKVFLAPTLQTKINNGRARITGMESMESANDLSIVLKAGALPAPVQIIEERTVGPSLGRDSIIAGSYSAAIGLALVMIFMIFYYRLSGLVADTALILNIIFIMAVMASLGATLTMPGIAGIILTIGMAVDANVLIFERIREELDRGKTVRAAVDQGYGQAFSAILDANVTTFIAGLVLFTYGSGPIKGFAVTLMIGIVASMFTAIIVTRVIFTKYLEKSAVTKLSI